ncbi:MAG: DUF1186 domain-containing protein [Nostocales cyanobacterium 94392]|nr:DUF1186 domain-containing protein [Nostocales cyanobacterium 94392]
MQLEEILSELENNTGKFPHQALERAIEEKEAITPFLLTSLSESKDNLEDLFNKPDSLLHLYALFLLAQFKEPLAYPLIIEFFSVPGDMSLNVTGDVVTEDLSRILASVSHGNIDPIKPLIENQEVNEYVKGAALRSLIILVVQGIVSREQIVQYFKELFSLLFANKSSMNAAAEEEDYIWTELAINGSILAPKELQEYIERTFDEDLIEPFFFARDDFDDYLENGSEANLNELRDNPHYSLIEDTISEMKSWACFEINKPSIFMEPEEFYTSSKKAKSKAKKKKKMQKESRRKNRNKKK